MASVNKPGGPACGSGKEHSIPIPVPPTVRLSHAPRQSTATQIRLKVIQGSVERLMGEVEELGDIKQFLVNLRNQMDEETTAIHIMNDIAFQSLASDVLMPDFEEMTEGLCKMLESGPRTEIKEEEEVVDNLEIKEADSKMDSCINSLEEWEANNE